MNKGEIERDAKSAVVRWGCHETAQRIIESTSMLRIVLRDVRESRARRLAMGGWQETATTIWLSEIIGPISALIAVRAS